MTNFIEERFPTDISFGAVGGPEFSTNIATTANGCEYRNTNWHNARCRYNISYGIKTEAQLNELITFFRTKKGKAIGFRFKDYSDFSAHNQVVGIGDGSTKEFQLYKAYTSYSTEHRKITKPVKNTIKIYIGGVVTEEYAVDYTSGKITFYDSPKTGEHITADFEFDVPVRFESDYLALGNSTQDFYSLDNINLIEIKL